ncbi:MAG: TIM barrel protein [Gammaproteobacteria bacterium]|nr:TIM barrel protein [Gammaproteobacteria bacterium]
MNDRNRDSPESPGVRMTRKTFLQSLGGIAAMAAMPGTASSATDNPAATAARKPQPKLGASLYSYNGDLQLGTMTLDDCLADLADMGAEGVEFLPDAAIPTYPNPSKEWLDNWFRSLDKYRLTPTALDGCPDTKLYRTRACSAQEIADLIIRDLKLAKQLGFTVYRGLGNSWPATLGPKGTVWASGVTQFDVYERILPVAEKYDVRLGEELHIPFEFRSEWMEQTLAFIRKSGTRHLGFVPDMSIFLRKLLPRMTPEALVGRGMRKDIVDYIFSAREAGVQEEVVMAEVARMGGKAEVSAAAMVFHLTYPGSRRNSPGDLEAIMPYVFHIHGKFYEIQEDLSDEYGIPYSEIIPVLAKAGYSNYLSSEYEGDRGPFVASHQLRRQHVMIRRMWAAALES